jgi:hypothetical protein
MKGQTDEAINQFREALRLAPGFAEARNNFGIALIARMGRRMNLETLICVVMTGRRGIPSRPVPSVRKDGRPRRDLLKTISGRWAVTFLSEFSL